MSWLLTTSYLRAASAFFIILNILILLLAAAVFACLAVYDAVHRRLPNVAVSSVAVLCFFYFFLGPLKVSDLPSHLFVAAAGFIFGSIIFAARWMGGGDVKMLAVLMLWAGPNLAMPTVLVVTFSGALLGIFCVLLKTVGTRHKHYLEHSALKIFSSDRGVPYGIALSIGGFFVLHKYFQSLSQSL